MKDEGSSITRDFTVRFKRELDAATSDAEGRLGGHAVRNYKIAFGDPRERKLIGIESAVGRLLKDAPLLPPIIDISVLEFRNDCTVVFVRPSSHHPVPWAETWDLPAGRGPFKVLVAKGVKDRRSSDAKDTS
jgi:hypothetical protein